MKTKIACVQFDTALADKEKNIKTMEALVKKTVTDSPDVDLILFPELALTGYECGEEYEKIAEEFPSGPSIKAMGKIAKDNKVHIVFGMVERDQEKLYNSAVLVNHIGEAQGIYRKVHLVEGADTKWFESGTEYPVFDTPFGKLGMMICWDSAFPEVARILALKGAEIIAVPAAWEAPNDGDWDLVISARSFDNVVYIAATNRVGTDKELTFFGKSKVVGPIGRTIVEAKDRAETIVGEVDLDELREQREGYYALLKDRRPESYGEILNKNYN